MSRRGPANLLPIVFPLLLFLALYGRSLDYEFVWTDQGEIEMGLLIVPVDEIGAAFSSPMLSGLAMLAPGATQSYYRPLQVAAVSWIDHHFGRTPRNFRALNLALGAATSALLAWLVLALSGSRGAALFAGSLYAVHPANLESLRMDRGILPCVDGLLPRGEPALWGRLPGRDPHRGDPSPSAWARSPPCCWACSRRRTRRWVR